jgi:1,4-dihydroxy-2-naphthoyl-CoA hydrolase
MTIWKKPATPEAINAHLAAGGATALFGIRVTAIEADAVIGEMTLGPQHLQPRGLLHGGVSVVLAETLGTLACILTLPEDEVAVGLEVNANHVSPAREGETVVATCRPLHTGRRTQVWQTEIRRADGKLVCVSRLTCAVIEASHAMTAGRSGGTPRAPEV